MSKGLTVAHAVRGCRGVNALAKEGEQLAEQLEQANASRDYWMKAAQKTDETCGKLAEQAKSLSESRARMAARVVELSHQVARVALDGEKVRKELARTEHSRRRAHARVQRQRRLIGWYFDLLRTEMGKRQEAEQGVEDVCTDLGQLFNQLREEFGGRGLFGLVRAVRSAFAIRRDVMSGGL